MILGNVSDDRIIRPYRKFGWEKDHNTDSKNVDFSGRASSVDQYSRESKYVVYLNI